MHLRTIVLAFAALVGTPVFAATIDFSSPMLSLDGTPFRHCEKDTPECKKPVTLAEVATGALLSPDFPGRPPTEGMEKAKRYDLALKIYKGGKADVSAEDIVLLKSVIGSNPNYSPAVVGRAYELMEPKGKP